MYSCFMSRFLFNSMKERQRKIAWFEIFEMIETSFLFHLKFRFVDFIIVLVFGIAYIKKLRNLLNKKWLTKQKDNLTWIFWFHRKKVIPERDPMILISNLYHTTHVCDGKRKKERGSRICGSTRTQQQVRVCCSVQVSHTRTDEQLLINRWVWIKVTQIYTREL